MSIQFSLMVLVVALATGMVTSVVATTGMQARQPGFFRYFLTNVLLFNLLILSGLVFRYLQIQLHTPEMHTYGLALPMLMVLMATLKLAWLFAFVMMNDTLPRDRCSKPLQEKLLKTGIFIFSGYCIVMTTTWILAMDDLQQFAGMALEVITLGGAMVSALFLLFSALGLDKDRRRTSILIFASYHMVLFALILLFLLAGWYQAWSQRPSQLVTNGVFLILYNVFPLIWIRWFQPLPMVSDSEKFKLFGITRREREVIRLIQEGKTNQEIADELYISVATVKDHNHNIFKKCGTRNRLELAKLFQ